MGYSIAEVAEKTHLTAHTLRYYEKEGLLPFIDRSDSGNRDFKDKDFHKFYLLKLNYNLDLLQTQYSFLKKTYLFLHHF